MMFVIYFLDVPIPDLQYSLEFRVVTKVYIAKQLLKDRQPVTAVAKPLVAWQRP